MKRAPFFKGNGKAGGAATPSVSHRFFGGFFRTGGFGTAIRLLALAVLDAMSMVFLWTLAANGRYPITAVVFLVTAGVNVAFLFEKAYPLRWFSPGLALMIIMLVYPTAYTIYVAFTNYGDGHLLTKAQVVNQLESVTFSPEDAPEFSWTAYRSESGEFALWLRSAGAAGSGAESGEQGEAEGGAEGAAEAGGTAEGGDFLALPGEPLIPAADAPPELRASRDAEGIPRELPGYSRLNRIDVVRFLDAISEVEFGEPPRTVRVLSLDRARRVERRYLYDGEADRITDRLEGTVYRPKRGTFTAEDAEEGKTLRPGFWVAVGAENFRRLFTSPALTGPFLRVFLWTFIYAILSVVLAFSFGLFFALVFNHPKMPGKRVIRSLMLIPYALPAFISVNIWRAMFSRHFGVIHTALESLFGGSPLWLADPFWARIGILIVQTWLGFPYMMLICTGALQSLPSELFEAATIDGAGPWRKFRNLTLPLLLVSVGPLLIGSFVFNFNNFTVIDIYAEGGPPMAGTVTPAGHTDILITYIFRLAFAGGRGADYGYAAAITIVIFVVLAVITALQFRYTRIWEEISENV